jgi:DNA repair exonuclease SbcCD nuclease subunit
VRIGNISDVHIGIGRRWFSDTTSENPRYLQRHKMCLDEITTRCQEVKVDCIILAGDLLDSSKPTAQEYSVLADWLYSLAEIAPTYVTVGNHEELSKGVTALHPVAAMMQHSNLHWRLDLSVNDEPWGNTLWCPHYCTGELQKTIDETPDLEYVVAHYAHKGAVFENGYAGVKGWDIRYPSSLKQVFLGDIHARQKLSSASEAWYPGSPLQLNFGEGGSKGFDIYDTETGKRDQVLLKNAPPLLTVDVRDEVPNFLANALYRVRVTKKYVDYQFPENVVSVQLLGAPEKAVEKEQADTTNQIDFGNPLAGIDRVLDRGKVDTELRADVLAAAKEIVRQFA